MFFSSVFLKPFAYLIVFTLCGCVSAPSYMDNNFRYTEGLQCLLLKIPENEVAVVPIKDFDSSFGVSDSREDMVAAIFLERLSSKSHCFQVAGGSDFGRDLSKVHFDKFEEHIRDTHIRVNILNQSSRRVIEDNRSLVLILNNITFKYIGDQIHLPSNNMVYGQSLTLEFDYALQDLSTMELVAYGAVSGSRPKIFSSGKQRWIGLIENSTDQLLMQIGMPVEGRYVQ